jgi:hypothetical protein
MLSGTSWLASVFDKDREVVDKAVEIVQKFNNAGHVNKAVMVNMPGVWRYLHNESNRIAGIAGARVLVEPMIENFQKFNSNSGWVLEDQQRWTHVMQV